jgi:hypothetical protein
MHTPTKRKMKQLYRKSSVVMTTSIAVLLASLITIAILPTLLIRYLYAGQQLFEQPALLEYIPVASFVIGMGYFLYAVVTNFMRSQQISRLEKQLEMDGDSCYCGDDCNCGHDHDHDHAMHEVDSLAEALMKKKSPSKKSKSSSKK